ncbi:hypothetical protein [Acinetobacter guillouiae]|uniref:hypothetical protein n=1 Tax=Acinetobacter guillouiae TaxID=106649 RepID=UPI003AF76A8E
MNFFEMIYHSGPEDFKYDFYKNNTEESRKLFCDRMMCAELAGDFHLGDSRQLTDKSLLPFDLVS